MSKLIIFDCDGVLVDSELIINTVFSNLLAEIGIHFKIEEMYEHFVGYSFAQCLIKIKALSGKMPPPDFEKKYRQETTSALEKDLLPVYGIKEFIQQLDSPYCVASSGSHKRMQSTLGITGLLPYFKNNIFSVHDVTHGKPHPDVYLYAAKIMGFKPSECIVIEDSPLGVSGGVAAGMIVLGYAERTPVYKLEDAGAHQVFSQMKPLLNYIQDDLSHRINK